MDPSIAGLIVEGIIRLAASTLVGMASGVLAVHLIIARRGRVSLENGVLAVALAAFELTSFADRVNAWLAFLYFFLLGATVMGLVVLALDSRRAVPRFPPRIRSRGLLAVPVGLILGAVLFLAMAPVIFDIQLANLGRDPFVWQWIVAPIVVLLTLAGLADAAVRLAFRTRRRSENPRR